MVKVLLINIPWILPKGYGGKVTIMPPIGLAYIASYLEKNGIEMKILDALVEDYSGKEFRDSMWYGLAEQNIIAKIKQFNPDFIGVSCPFTSQYYSLEVLCSILKDNFPKIPIVVGGSHASSCTEEVMKNKNIDYIVVGEGEHAMLDIVRGKVEDRVINGIPIEDLDSLPLPAYRLLDIEKYKDANLRSGKILLTSLEKKWVSIVTSRGCPYNCFFCSIHNVFGRKWRARSPENVLEEMEILVKKYSIKHLLIVDDNFTLNMDRVKSILRGMIKRKLNVTWEAIGVRADRLDEELVRLMKESGCSLVAIGIECGDEDYRLNVMKKNLNIYDVLKAVKMFNKVGIDVNGNYMLGMPGENKEMIMKTGNLIIKLARKGVFPIISMATPLPGTDMADMAEKNNLLIKKVQPVDLITIGEKPLIKVEGFTEKDFIRFRKRITFLYLVNMLLFNPKRFLKMRKKLWNLIFAR